MSIFENMFVYTVCIRDRERKWQCYGPDKWDNVYKPYYKNYCYGPSWFLRGYNLSTGKKDPSVTMIRHFKYFPAAKKNMDIAYTLGLIEFGSLDNKSASEIPTEIDYQWNDKKWFF